MITLKIKKVITALTTNLLILVVCFSLVVPTHAATLKEVEHALTELQTAFLEYQAAQSGKVLGASIINVSNDRELFDALGTVTGGETIILAPGIYGRIYIGNGKYTVGILAKSGYVPKPSSVVKITSADINNRAVIQGFEVQDSNNWHLEGLSFFPIRKTIAVRLAGDNIKFINNNISFGNTQNWDATQWKSVDVGINVGGNNNEVAYNYVKNISAGINIGGTNAYVHHNYITNFSIDGMRGLGQYSRIEHNYITNPIRSSATNHYDGFQSYSRGADGKVGTGLIEGMVLRSNTIMYETKSVSSASALIGIMQGMSMFDGSAKGAVIENNLIVVNHFHGMTWAGAIDTVFKITSLLIRYLTQGLVQRGSKLVTIKTVHHQLIHK